jgi:hypothetical protein
MPGGIAVPDAAIAAGIKLALQPRAASEAPGMKPEGEPTAGNLQEGQTLTFEFMAQPGKCYQVLGTGLGVQQLDITIAPKNPIPNMPPLPAVAQSSTAGANASSSPPKSCYKYPFPVPAAHVVTIKATRGAGAAGAQLYTK